MPSKHEALNLSSSITKKKEEEEERKPSIAQVKCCNAGRVTWF
jgi:hypothetical protein